MLKHFTGTYDHKVDDKGRVSLPTEFRRVLDAVGSSDSLYIVPMLENGDSHVVFTMEAYSNLIERHNTAEYPDLTAQHLMELKLVKRASQVQVDDMGRIVLNKALRECIKLEKQVKFVGVASSFEIWNPGAHDAYEDALLSSELTAPVHIDRRGLH